MDVRDPDPAWIAFLQGLKLWELRHTRTTYGAHLTGTWRLLQAWGASPRACAAGFFHSIYGTERFTAHALPLGRRPDVARLIGIDAEILAYWNCAVSRPEVDRFGLSSQNRFSDRRRGGSIRMGRVDLLDLYRIQLADWLEQLPRVRAWSYRRESYQNMATALGGAAAESYRKVMACAEEA